MVGPSVVPSGMLSFFGLERGTWFLFEPKLITSEFSLNDFHGIGMTSMAGLSRMIFFFLMDTLFWVVDDNVAIARGDVNLAST